MVFGVFLLSGSKASMVQDSKNQSLKGKNGKLKEKAAALKGTIQEFETVLQRERAQYRELEDSLEEHQSHARRRERQLSNDLVLVTQVLHHHIAAAAPMPQNSHMAVSYTHLTLPTIYSV